MQILTHLQAAVGRASGRCGGIDDTEFHCMTIGEFVHSFLSNVEASIGVVDGEDVDRRPVVCDAPARATLSRVPASYG